MRTRRIASVVAATALLGALGGGASGAMAAKTTTPKTTVKVGAVCKKAGSKVKLKNGKTLKCVKVGKKLVYR